MWNRDVSKKGINIVVVTFCMWFVLVFSRSKEVYHLHYILIAHKNNYSNAQCWAIIVLFWLQKLFIIAEDGLWNSGCEYVSTIFILIFWRYCLSYIIRNLQFDKIVTNDISYSKLQQNRFFASNYMLSTLFWFLNTKLECNYENPFRG